MTVLETLTYHKNHVRTRHPNRTRPEIPLLENGDRLSREEFERRYHAMPHLKKAELIGGRVYMPSPVKRTHSKNHADMITWLGVYSAATPGVEANDNGTVRLDDENEPQPDASLHIESEEMGTSYRSEDDYIEGAPELIVEIAASSASYDLHEKLEAYRHNGVKEYLVWQVYENCLTWFELREGRYVAVEPNSQGILRSRVFPGLYLAVDALLSGAMAEVLNVLQQGPSTKQHEDFVKYLKEVDRKGIFTRPS